MKLTASSLSEMPRISHGFFTRRGGVSEGIYASLNCGLGSQDSPEAVTENRRRAADQFGIVPERLLTCYQRHSADVVEVSGPWDDEGPRRADALVTSTPALALGILTADCLPVLLADGAAGVIGAAHAGWKGALGGVLEATLEAMGRLGASTERIVAATGPAIALESYEVGPDFRANFLARNQNYARFFTEGPRERPHFDLKAFAVARLRATGIRAIESLPQDTCSDEENFFSYRRACHRGETDYGRGLSAICLMN